MTLPRELGTSSVSLDILDHTLSSSVALLRGLWERSELGLEAYLFELPIKSIGVGLYFLRFALDTAFGRIYATHSCGELSFTSHQPCEGLPQLTVCSFAHPAPEGIYGSTIYHVFVDRFARGGSFKTKPDAVRVPGRWKEIPEFPEYAGAPLKNNTFFGGDLKGVEKKLDYIASLGVGAIYLSPIFESVSNHKYDTADYTRVDSMFGGERALKSLIRAARERGIAIILDGVFNHTGADSVYFNRYGRYDSIGAYNSVDSEFYPWFDFQHHPDKYTCWWDIEILPRINPDIPECRNFFTGEGGVIEKWRELGVYGFRLDVADELSDDFISAIKDKLAEKGESILYGEVWEDASNKIAYDKRKQYYLGRELDGVMNYPLRTGLIDFIRDGRFDRLRYALTEVLENAPDRVLHSQMNLLGTHDTERIITVLGAESGEGHTNAELCRMRMTAEQRAQARARLKMAYTALATLPGIPTIFYGDEAGLEGYHDPFNRMPYPWGREDKELLMHYRLLGGIRESNPVYKKGAFELIELSGDLLIYSRKEKGEVFLTVVNRGAEDITLRFDGCFDGLISAKRGRYHTVKSMTADIFKGKRSAKFELEK